ncbi:DNA-binding protein [Paraburkholderia sp. PREW-6R]|uniref:DNA-binding protein n=1 Tax=Paraburkholderia sp. PREW-6R TaxID=3141544 RepID=UPI0031F58791
MSMDANTITDEQIAEIADRQVTDGQRVSPLTVWSEIRSGSIVAIAAALQRWREARQPSAPPVPIRSAIPHELSESFTGVASRLWSTAQNDAERAMNERLAVLNTQFEAVAEERDEALGAYQRMINELDAAREQIEALTNASSAAESAAASLRDELAQATAREHAAEAREAQLAQRASEAEHALSQSRAAHEEERRAQEASLANAASLNEELARSKAAHEEERRAHEASLANVAGLNEELERVKAAHEDERRVHEASAATIASLNEELLHTRAALDEQRQAHEASLATGAGLSEELANSKAAHDELRHAHEALTANVARQSEDIARLTNERDEARARASTLESEFAAKSDDVQRWTQEANAATERAESAMARANAAAAQAEESVARIAALEAELADARALLASEREANATHQQNASTHTNELQRLSRELEEARQQIVTLNEAKAATAEELARAVQEASAAQARVEKGDQYAAILEQRLADQSRANQGRLRAEEAQHHPQANSGSANTAASEEVAALQRQLAAQAKAYEKALHDLRANAEQWVAHSRELKQRLGVASEKVLFVDARSNAEVALLRRLSSELERLKPDHELVSRDIQQKMIYSTMSERLAQRGYRYDPATSTLSKLES